MKLVAFLTLSLVAGGIFASAGQAQTISSNYKRIEKSQEAGPFAGLFSGGTGRFGFGPKSGVIFGARYGIELGGPFSFETVAGLVTGSRDVIDPELAEGSRVSGESDVQLLVGEARFKFAFPGRRTWHSLSPHLLIGGGVTYDFAGIQSADERILEMDRFDFGTAFHVLGGAGARFFLNDTWSLRADGTVRVWQLQTPTGYGEANRGFENVETSEWTNNLSLSFGLAYRF